MWSGIRYTNTKNKLKLTMDIKSELYIQKEINCSTVENAIQTTVSS